MVTYEEYLKALDIVLEFQKQLINTNDKIKVEVANADGSMLLIDFLKSLDNKRPLSAIRNNWYHNEIEFEKCTVEYFLNELYFDQVNRRRNINVIRGIGNESTIELLQSFESRGFDIKMFKPYYKGY